MTHAYLKYTPAFPKPKQVLPPPDAVRVYRSGREVCNRMTAEGAREYKRRIKVMWERQNGICCLFGHISECPGPLSLKEATFEHEDGRGNGGGNRDDRIEVNGKWRNGAAHLGCNGIKGSRRIKYNS